jgi:hypothetical protein
MHFDMLISRMTVAVNISGAFRTRRAALDSRYH